MHPHDHDLFLKLNDPTERAACRTFDLTKAAEYLGIPCRYIDTGDIWGWYELDVSAATNTPGLTFWVGWHDPYANVDPFDPDDSPLDLTDFCADHATLGHGRNGPASSVREGWFVYIGYTHTAPGEQFEEWGEYIGEWVDVLTEDGWITPLRKAMSDAPRDVIFQSE